MVPGVYRTLLENVNVDEKDVIDEKIRKMKSVFVIVYKLLMNYPVKAANLLAHMKKIFDEDEHKPEPQESNRVGKALDISVRHMKKARRTIK
jgi:hypothetical protein